MTDIATFTLNRPRGQSSEKAAHGRQLNPSKCADKSTDNKKNTLGKKTAKEKKILNFLASLLKPF